ncbi:protein NO VEIN domain-containing protein [Odoribacter laneus]|uniref:Protein NO VEIN C-terminal domain-containing protein n=1 Tax=Odoribacter laneus YIT 12061 TaxID=742817 RepID=H1DEG7_9BACT|nr:DUF3883 domain-containing protein [Odoribacter laneus]EHP50064.1 hypothetical protein HMPREF9449_00653 [Odoribacter laneus YIT 12061]
MRGKFKYYPITYGHILASWYILYLVAQYKLILPETLNKIIKNSGKLGGTIPVKQGIKICHDYELITIKKEGILLTEISQNRIVPLCSNDDPNIKSLRAILFHIVSYHNFSWLIFYDSDPDIFRNYLIEDDPEWTNLLDNAKLFDFSDEEVNQWWSNVLEKYEDYKEKLKKAIGDVGEKLTYIYELQRVKNDGYRPEKSFVKWAARIDDHFGFDIQSIRGKYFCHTFLEKDKIQIEVKSSESIKIDSFRFYISKPEWLMAQKNFHSYFFYCWVGVDIDKESAMEGPYVIPAIALKDKIPTDNSNECEWSECRCVIDLSKFKLLH